MADRFWVAGSGNWSDNTNHWSATSGGSPNASLPTSSDNVFIDSNSGLSGGTITLDTDIISSDFISSTGFSYTISGENSFFLNVYGSLTLESTITFDIPIGLLFYATSTGKTITSAGKTFFEIDFLGVDGGWNLQDDLTTESTEGIFYMENGTFNANNQNVSSATYTFFVDTTNTPTITMGSGTWSVTGNGGDDGTAWLVDENNGLILTINPGTSTIKLTDATSSNKGFYGDFNNVGNIHTYNNIWFTGSGTGTFIIQGSNIFNDFKVDTPPHIIQFINGTTTTVNTFTVNGTAGNLMTLESDTTSAFNLIKSGGGVISSDYLSIIYSTATPESTWYAGAHSTDGGNNTGWIFTSSPIISTKNAPLDDNDRPGMICVLDTDPTIIIQAKADPTIHGLSVSDGTGGTDNGNNDGQALIDENSNSVWIAESSAGDGAIVEVYANSSGEVLINSN